MKPPRRRSLRTVLTLWNAALLTVLLGAFGLAIVFANQNRLRAVIDDDLVGQANQATRGGMPPPPPPGEAGPFRDPQTDPSDDATLGRDGGRPNQGGAWSGQDFSLGQSPEGSPNGGPSGGPSGGPAGPGEPPDPYAMAGRIADVRRPRFYNLDGKPLHRRDNPVPFDAPALKLALAGHAVFANSTVDGQSIRIYSRPLMRDGRVIGAGQFARELSDLDLLWTAQLGTLAAVLPLSILAAAGAAYALTGRTLRPVARLTATAAEIGRSRDLSRRLDVKGDDEMAELARTFNDMLARLDRSFSELEAAFAKLGQAYEQQQRFTADASHELRTPLTRLRLATSAALAPDVEPDDMRLALATADRAAGSMTRLVEHLLTLARADAGQLGLQLVPTDLRVVVAEGLEDISTARPIETMFDEAPLTVQADPDHLRRVVVNLVENALRYTPEEATVFVGLKACGGEAVLMVRDTGNGIAPEHLAHLGERFYRVDEARTRQAGGNGLGLAICRNLVEAHAGRLEIDSKLGAGTIVRATFPLFSPKSLPGAPIK